MSLSPSLPSEVSLIELPAHGTAVYVAPSRESYEGACRFFCTEPLEDRAGVTHFIEMKERDWRFILIGICVPEDEEVIPHECAHAALWVFRAMGQIEMCTEDRNEPFAWLLGYLAKEVTRIVREAS